MPTNRLCFFLWLTLLVIGGIAGLNLIWHVNAITQAANQHHIAQLQQGVQP